MTKVAVCSSENSPSALMEGRFGRCHGFLVWDTADARIEYIANGAVDAAHGAGTGAVQELVNHRVTEVIARRVGPKAFAALKQAGIKVYESSEDDKCEEAYRKHLEGKLDEILSPNS